MDRVNKITLWYNLSGQKNQKELRELIVEISENFLERINSNQEIRDHLVEYPFPAKYLDFSITLIDKEKKGLTNKADTNEIFRGVSLFKGIIRYEFTNEEKPYVQTLYQEPYEEAFQIVKKQKPDLFS